MRNHLNNYLWIEDWIKVPPVPIGDLDGRTHGVVVTRAGNVIIFHHGNPGVLTYSPDGILLNSWGNFPGAHGMTLVEENEEEFLWLVDEMTRQVAKTTLEGKVIQTLDASNLAAYKEADYVPTWVAVNERRFGGNGDLWLVDGYGSSLLHCFDKTGRYLETLDGTEGAGRFKCPHGVALDVRSGTPEMYIADRGNKQIQVYGIDRKFRRAFGSDFLTSPNISSSMGNYLIVPELASRISILNIKNELVAQIGQNDLVATKPGWPDERAWIQPELFNSPHDAAADSQGNIYVVEWILGGRVTKLKKV